MTHSNRHLARAKINLTLHVTGRRPDGLHLLDSLVVFAEVGDVIEVTPAAEVSLTIDGPFAQGLSVAPDNLVLRAAAHVGAVGAIRLTKVLPVSSGIGGGSADAAATVRAMVDTLPDARSLQVLGADVPVCLASRTARMRGIGEVLEAVPDLPPCWVVLVNPGVGVSTPAVFRALETADNPPMELPDSFADFDGFTTWLGQQRNDLQEPACQVAPVIRDALTELGRDAALARMSGSGATCFGLYPNEAAARRAADRLRAGHPDWWVAAAPLRRD